jgi:alpha-ketoglutarate-dependent taurine dioxygenase
VKRRLALPEIGDISNLDEEGRLRRRDDRRRLDSLGNRLWHTDASYMPVPVVLGMLYAVTVPPTGPLGSEPKLLQNGKVPSQPHDAWRALALSACSIELP